MMMRLVRILILLLGYGLFNWEGSSQEVERKKSPDLRGDYLGQKLPVRQPEMFARPVVSSSQPEHGRIVFSPDLREVNWSVARTGDQWSEPATLVRSVNSGQGDGGPSCAKNGTLYFWSSREG